MWARLAAEDAYRGTDEGVGERPPRGWSALFPHPLRDARSPEQFYQLWTTSPYSDVAVVSLAAGLTYSLKLGQRAAVDFLGIGLSAIGKNIPDMSRPLEALAFGWIGSRWLYQIFSMLALGVGLYGVVLLTRRSAIGFVLVFYLAILAIWPHPPDRFLWAVLPWLTLAWAVGLFEVARIRAENDASRKREAEFSQYLSEADRTALTLPRYASQPHRDPRAPQNLLPIAGLERALKRRLGDAALLERQLRAAAVRLPLSGGAEGR